MGGFVQQPEWPYKPWTSVNVEAPPVGKNIFAAVALSQGYYDYLSCGVDEEDGRLTDSSTGDEIGWHVGDITYWFAVPALPPLPRRSRQKHRLTEEGMGNRWAG